MSGLPVAQLPPAQIAYPRPLESIHQVEITSHCNLRCPYCPSPKLDRAKEAGGFGRAKEHMTLATFERALAWAAYFERNGQTQGELSLTGIGETLLHPHWMGFCRMARAALPRNPILFSTNGLLLDEAACAYLAEMRIGVYVSLHRPEKAGPAIEAAKRHGILLGTNTAAAESAFDWAGALAGEWHVSAPAITCEYLRSGWGVVLADGRVTTCCLDATGDGVVGHVDDELGSLAISPWSGEGPGGCEIGCEPCHMDPP